MKNMVIARRLGLIGMAGALSWIIGVFLHPELGLVRPEQTALVLAHEVTAIGGLLGVAIGSQGLRYAGAFAGRVGPLGVSIYGLAYGLIVLAGVIGQFLPESPLLLLFPIGGTLADVGLLLIGGAALVAGRWGGWQRWLPVLLAAYQLLAIALPFVLGITPDGPGPLAELPLGLLWLGLGLAIRTARPAAVVPQPVADPV